MKKLEEKVLQFIRENQMMRPNENVLVGVSGGADSVSLLVILSHLASVLQVHLYAVTVHHGIRGKSADADVSYVEELCKKLEIALYKEYVDVPTLAKKNGYSEEEAGRKARYDCFYQLAKKIEKTSSMPCLIAVAHHRQDDCETILHNLFRGSGLTGLRGMLPIRNQVIRPLLETSREEIEAYLAEEGISYCIDETNKELIYTRNKLRKKVIPYLREEINKKSEEHILEAAKQISQAEEFILDYVKKWIAKNIKKTSLPVEIPLQKFQAEKPIIQTYIIRVLFEENKLSLKDVTRLHFENAIDILNKQVGSIFEFPRNIQIRKGYDALILENKSLKEKSFTLPDVEYQIFSYDSSEKIPKTPCMKWFDYDKIKNALSVRTRQVGDYMQIYPEGGNKTIKSMMIDKKIPKEQRDKIPLLVEGSHVLWMMGYRISEAYKVTENTKTILQVSVNMKEEER